MKSNDSIPNGWAVVLSSEILDIRDGTHDTPKYVEKGIPLITSKNLKEGKIDFSKVSYISEDDHIAISKRSSVNQDDVLFAMIGTIGSPVMVKSDVQFSIKNVGLFKSNKSTILSMYLCYYLGSKSFDNQLLERQLLKGTTQKFIPLGHLRQLHLPLPPLAEQQRIVAKIEELFSELDKGIETLKTAQDQLKVYRQAVLKYAFEGRLTSDWRASNKVKTSAEILHTQIELARELYSKAQLAEWEAAIQNQQHLEDTLTNKKPSRPAKIIEPDKPSTDHEILKWVIPEEWLWTQIGKLCFVTKLAGFEYTDFVRYDESGDLPVLKAENAGLNGFKRTEFSKVHSKAVRHLKRSLLHGGEILIVFVGAGTGNVAAVPNDQKYFLGPNIGMARPYLKINSKFLEYQLQSLLGKRMLTATIKAVAQPSLSMGTIRQTPIVFTSIQEQEQIVQEIESRLSVCDKIEESIEQGLLQAEALRQSILKRAFEGKLVPQDPNDEPASVLLERIKSERAKAQPEKKSKKKKMEV